MPFVPRSRRTHHISTFLASTRVFLSMVKCSFVHPFLLGILSEVHYYVFLLFGVLEEAKTYKCRLRSFLPVHTVLQKSIDIQQLCRRSPATA